MEGFFSTHSQNVQPDDLLDGQSSITIMCIAMLRAGLAELVAWTKNITKGIGKGKDKSHRMWDSPLKRCTRMGNDESCYLELYS